jgi:hypothetical protein
MWSNTMWAIVRWTHVVAAVGSAVFLYKADEISALDPTRYLFFPLLLLTGIWLWAGRVRAAHRREAGASVPGAG